MPCETGTWQHLRHATLTVGNRRWHLWNRWPGTSSTNDPSPERRFRLPARTCCRLAMSSQTLLQLGAVVLHPAPDRGVIDIETTLLQQFLYIAQRKRIAKIPPDCTQYEAGFGLSPFEDRGSACHLAILSRHQPTTLNVATHPSRLSRRLLRQTSRRPQPRQHANQLLAAGKPCRSSAKP